MASPTLALCIPAYNAADCLPRLLRSAQAQTQPFDEIWVYDDASNDDTSDVASAHGARVVRGEVNHGCSWGKNVLAQWTNCDWIHFHDADDELLPNFVETARAWMEAPIGPDVVLFGYEYRGAEGEILATYRFDRSALEADAIAYCIEHQINPFCGLYRRAPLLACGGYDTDPAVLYNEDVAFHCRLAIAGLQFSADPTVTVINYHHSHSMSAANQPRCIRAQYQVMAKVAATAPSQYQAAIAQRLWQIAGVATAYLDWDSADACLRLLRSFNLPVHWTDRPWSTPLWSIHPILILRLRERWIRRFKPWLRPASHYPTAAISPSAISPSAISPGAISPSTM